MDVVRVAQGRSLYGTGLDYQGLRVYVYIGIVPFASLHFSGVNYEGTIIRIEIKRPLQRNQAMALEIFYWFYWLQSLSGKVAPHCVFLPQSNAVLWLKKQGYQPQSRPYFVSAYKLLVSLPYRNSNSKISETDEVDCMCDDHDGNEDIKHQMLN